MQRLEEQERETREQLEEQKREREEDRKERDAAKNKGKKLEEVGQRQKRRKMAELKTYYTKLALEPFESYGLTPLTVTAVTDQGCSVSLELCVSPAPSSSAPSSSAAAEPGGSTRNVLFLLDRFGVSDEFYHEVVRELPRLHHVKHLRKEMNTHVKSVRLKKYQGCYRPV